MTLPEDFPAERSPPQITHIRDWKPTLDQQRGDAAERTWPPVFQQNPGMNCGSALEFRRAGGRRSDAVAEWAQERSRAGS
jgi:hypothetical protein